MPMLEFLTFRRLLLVLTVQLTTLLQGMSITVISVVLPQMKGTLSATQDQIAWTVTFNLVATAIATPMTGWLAARLGWRNLLVGTVVGCVLFLAIFFFWLWHACHRRSALHRNSRKTERSSSVEVPGSPGEHSPDLRSARERQQDIDLFVLN